MTTFDIVYLAAFVALVVVTAIILRKTASCGSGHRPTNVGE
jgi:hypothetical protein